MEVRIVKHRSRTNPVKPNKGMQMFRTVNPDTDTEISLSTPTQIVWKCPCHPQHRHENMPGNPNTCMKMSLATPILLCSNIIVQQTLRQESAQKVDPGEENSPTVPARSWTWNLLIMSLVLYRWACIISNSSVGQALRPPRHGVGTDKHTQTLRQKLYW